MSSGVIGGHGSRGTVNEQDSCVDTLALLPKLHAHFVCWPAGSIFEP